VHRAGDDDLAVRRQRCAAGSGPCVERAGLPHGAVDRAGRGEPRDRQGVSVAAEVRAGEHDPAVGLHQHRHGVSQALGKDLLAVAVAPARVERRVELAVAIELHDRHRIAGR